MSQLIPQQTVDALRFSVDMAVSLYGQDVLLFLITNQNAVNENTAYLKPSDYTYRQRTTRCWIEWKPDQHRLRKLGLFVEGETPIIAWLSQQPDATINSFLRVPIQYVPRQYSTDEFDIVDTLIRGMQDAMVVQAYKIAPRRIRRMQTIVLGDFVDATGPAQVAEEFSSTLPLSGGLPPYVLSISSGALPGGLTLNSATGELSGIPTESGQFVFTVLVVDASGNAFYREYTLVVQPAGTYYYGEVLGGDWLE